MGQSLMAGQEILASERFWTLVADIRLLFGVRPIVALEMLQPSKRPGTSLALKGPGSLDHFPSR
jgi:hypothetical protein